MTLRMLFILSLAVMIINSTALTCLAYDYYGKLEVEVTEVPYKPVYAFMGLNFQGSARQANGEQTVGGVITLTSARPSDIQFESLVGYRSITTQEGGSATGAFDIMLGGTFFPRKPSFAFLGMPVRLKMSMHGGMVMANEILFSACVSLSLVFSSGDDPSGMTIGVTYWPSIASGETKLPSSVCATLGFLFAPSAAY